MSLRFNLTLVQVFARASVVGDQNYQIYYVTPKTKKTGSGATGAIWHPFDEPAGAHD